MQVVIALAALPLVALLLALATRLEDGLKSRAAGPAPAPPIAPPRPLGVAATVGGAVNRVVDGLAEDLGATPPSATS